MCDHCGCRGVPAIRELIDEHTSLIDESAHVREALRAGDPGLAGSILNNLVERLNRHVQREEDGIFRALRSKAEYITEVTDLETEHRDLEAAIAALDAGSPEFGAQVTSLLDDLQSHVDREDYGIFPVAVVTLGAEGWQIVDDAHAESPSFLLDRPSAASRPSAGAGKP